jgi:hypothetical protein
VKLTSVSRKQNEDTLSRHNVRLPGFISDDREIGLGDVIKAVTSSVGIKACGGCEKRAAVLNRWITFSR